MKYFAARPGEPSLVWVSRQLVEFNVNGIDVRMSIDVSSVGHTVPVSILCSSKPPKAFEFRMADARIEGGTDAI